MTFDGLDRLGTASGVWGSGSFGYDTVGNITSKVLGSQNLSYSYQSASNRLSTVSGGYTFTYDDRGNVINNGKRAFQFNRANQLVSSGTISYQYDGHGRRVKKTGSSSGYSVYDLSGTLLLTDGPNGQTRYIHLGKELIAKSGSAAALEDKPGYTGHVEDRDLSLTYMQQRYYDPVIGRFYSNDPVGFTGEPDTFNRYSYANNNPYKYTDPDGRFPALARMMVAPPVAPTSSSLPNIPGRPGVPSGSGSSTGVTNSPIILTNPIIATAVVVLQNADNSQSNTGNNGNANSGTQTSSTTTWNGKGKERIDVENPNPEAGTGNIHYHDVNNTKYKYNSQTGGFDGLSKKQNEKLKNTYGAQNGIEKGKKILGEIK
jgi:RHS repeat-associated protein